MCNCQSLDVPSFNQRCLDWSVAFETYKPLASRSDGVLECACSLTLIKNSQNDDDVERHRTCKDNTSKDPFSQCENLQNLQGIRVQVKSEYVGILTTSEVMTRMQSDKHNNMF